MFVETTWEAILAEIARIPLEKANVRLGERVVGVQTMDRESEGSRVVVSTEKGEHLSFDEVLMTTPLGWLRRNKDIFQPALPERLLAGIDGVSVGHLEKVELHSPPYIVPEINNHRSTSHSPPHSGSTRQPPNPIPISPQSSSQKQTTLSQATQTGSPLPTPSQQTHNASQSNAGTSPPSHHQTPTQH